MPVRRVHAQPNKTKCRKRVCIDCSAIDRTHAYHDYLVLTRCKVDLVFLSSIDAAMTPISTAHAVVCDRLGVCENHGYSQTFIPSPDASTTIPNSSSNGPSLLSATPMTIRPRSVPRVAADAEESTPVMPPHINCL